MHCGIVPCGTLSEQSMKAEDRKLILGAGTTDFGPLTLLCRPPTLIPRPETAHIFTRLAELLLTCHGDWRPLDGAKQTCPDQDQTLGGLRILDLCTGSGSIPLLLAHLLDTRCDRLIGYDYHPSAVELARENLELVLRQASTEKGVGRRAVVAAHQGDIFDEAFVGQVLDDFQSHPHVRERTELGDHLAGPMREKGTGKEEGQGDVDLVVSNPPYIARTEWEELPPSVKDYEDPRALIGERVLSTPISPASPPAQITESTMNTHGKGLVFYERIAEILPDVLSPVQDLQRRGWNSGTTPRVAVEIGHEQGEDVKAIFGSVGMRCEVWQDQYERDRMVVGWHR